MDVLIFFAFLAVMSVVLLFIVRWQWRKRPPRLGPGSGTAYGSGGYLDYDSRDGGGGGCGSGGGD